MRFEKEESYDNKNINGPKAPYPDWHTNYKSWRRVWSGASFKKILVERKITVKEFFDINGKEFVNELITPDVYSPYNKDFTEINPLSIAKNIQFYWKEGTIPHMVNLIFTQPSRNFEFEMKRDLNLSNLA